MPYKRYICLLCGFIYDEAQGWPEDKPCPSDYAMLKIHTLPATGGDTVSFIPYHGRF